ncbi:MAG TPA: hypothetical protein VKE23_05720, partial [Candidatus Limnocylindria bacterium]|nr:hypothetical protein [Candidatus Limnocylindria bacterium]
FTRIATLSRHEAPAEPGTLPARAARSQGRTVLRRVGRLMQCGHGWEWREITSRDVRVATARGRVFISDAGVGAAAVLGDRYEESLMVVAVGGTVRPLTDLLRAMRAVASRRGLDDVSFYVSSAVDQRAARSAGYRRPWSGETYLFEKRFRRGAP